MRIKDGTRIITAGIITVMLVGCITVAIAVDRHRVYTNLAHTLGALELAVAEIGALFSEQVNLGRMRALTQIEVRFEKVDGLIDSLRSVSPDEEGKTVEEISHSIDAARNVFDNLVTLRTRTGDQRSDEEILRRLTSQYAIHSALISRNMRYAKDHWAAEMAHSFDSTVYFFLGYAGLTFIVLVCAGVYLHTAVLSPVSVISRGAETLGSGNMDFRLPRMRAKNELAVLASTFNEMAGSLDKAIGDLKDEVALREAAELQLKERARELQRSNEELEQFAYVASHDLQEPLRIIVSYLQLFERRYSKDLDEDALTYMKATTSSANRMRELIRSLLAYSRIARKGEAFVAVKLEEVLHDVLTDLDIAVEESGARVQWDGLPTVQGDAAQLRQLFQNLVSNALKFRSEETPLIRIFAEQNGSEWELCVQDNGIGIEPKHAERIFVIFQRLHGRGQYPGTGIGLALCRRIVERHKGRIWVESQPGEGATFRFTLPA